APGVTAIQHDDKTGFVGKLTVIIVKLIVRDRRLARPGEVVGNQAGVQAIGFAVEAVAGKLGAVAAVEEEALVTGPDVVQQPLEALTDTLRCRALVENDADVV